MTGHAGAATAAARDGRPLVALDQVGRSFDGGSILALKDVTITIGRGELVAIHGPSGSGKSTLVNLMAGLDRPTSGHIAFDGRVSPTASDWARFRANSIGIVFQDFNLLPTLTASENIEVAMFGHLPRAERRHAAMARLSEVGLAALADRLPPQLSGGERQRIGVARAIANDPILLLADEPTSSLDSAAGAAVLDLLLQLHMSRRTALVIVTHEEALIERCARRIRLTDGRVAEDVRETRKAAE